MLDYVNEFGDLPDCIAEEGPEAALAHLLDGGCEDCRDEENS